MRVNTGIQLDYRPWIKGHPLPELKTTAYSSGSADRKSRTVLRARSNLDKSSSIKVFRGEIAAQRPMDRQSKL